MWSGTPWASVRERSRRTRRGGDPRTLKLHEDPSNDGFPTALAAIHGSIAHLQGPTDSLASHERAREILERLTRDHPAKIEYRGKNSAQTCCNIANLRTLLHRPSCRGSGVVLSGHSYPGAVDEPGPVGHRVPESPCHRPHEPR